MAKAVTLKNNNNEEIYPVTDISLVNGELNGARIVNASVGSDKLTPNAVWTENIKDGAVTSAKIAAPYWKVVSTVSTNAWTIPAGYRFYRLVMRCSTSAPSTASRPAIASSSKSNVAWSSWVSQDSGKATAGTANWNTSQNTITVVAPTANTVGCAPIVKMDLTRLTSGGTAFIGTWTCSGSGFDWTSVGKVEFPVSNGSKDFYLYFTRNASTLSDFLGYVEALVEK